MSLARFSKKLALLAALGAGTLAGVPRAGAGPLGIYDWCCCRWCPKYVHCQEGPPHIKMKIGCSRPICEPCSLPHFGYYQTCWTPWPFPPDWSHCPVPPPGALFNAVPPGPIVAPEGPAPGTSMPVSTRVVHTAYAAPVTAVQAAR